MLFKIIHSRKLLNKLTISFITDCFMYITNLRRQYMFTMTLTLCYC